MLIYFDDSSIVYFLFEIGKIQMDYLLSILYSISLALDSFYYKFFIIIKEYIF